MSLPRVLLVEDDASLRRFVSMALEDQPLQLQEVDSVAAALQALAAQPAHLIITDLMMPGESGLDLLRHLQQQPALGAGARVVVMSAGLNAEMREQLPALGAWRLLHKPVSLADLLACVQDGLAPAAAGALANASVPTPVGPAALSGAQEDAIQHYFGGQRALFLAYLEACHTQFPRDAEMADQAVRSGDAAALQRVAHSLKSVLLTLGHATISERARALEHRCAAGLDPQAVAMWQALRTELLGLPSPA